MAKPVYWDENARQKPNIRKLVEQPFQQSRAGMADEWGKTLMEYEFLQGKVEAGMLGDLLDDYGRMEGAVEEVRLVRDAIRLSAHVLRVDKNQLPSQLHGRLVNNKAKPIGALLQSALHYTQYPLLRPITASILHPGCELVRILVGK